MIAALQLLYFVRAKDADGNLLAAFSSRWRPLGTAQYV
jgi:hypothetical protein